jgi:ATP-dependent Clp protease ATP-binding subunit ClpA
LAFAAINRPQAVRIAERLLNQLSQSLERHGIVVQTDAAAVELLLDNGGFDPELGVRPLKRAIARLLEAPLAEKILAGELSRGDTVLIGVEAGQLCFDALSDRPTVEELAS